MRFISLATFGLFFLSMGCIGPSAVRSERPDFNDAIAVTSRQQVLMNIVRVHNHEQPQFVDVSAITNQSQFSGSITGTATLPQMIGTVGKGSTHSGHDFSPGFTIGGYDQPSVTYSPLTGQALVQQIAQPITVDSIAALYDSDWPIRSILTFVADRIAPTPDYYFHVIDNIQHLQIIGVLTMVAVKSSATGGAGTNDSLVLFCDPNRAPPALIKRAKKEWAYLQKVYAETYVDPLTIGPAPPKPAKDAPDGASPVDYSIELRTLPATQPSLPAAQVIPLLRMRSALGVLVTATDDLTQYITFLSPTAYDKLWKPDQNNLFYQYVSFTLDEKVKIEEKIPPIELETAKDILDADRTANAMQKRSWRDAAGIPNKASNNTTKTDSATEGLAGVTRIGYLSKRPLEPYETGHYIAIIENASCPADAYVAISYHGKCYYIQHGDTISQRNFELLTQLLNMQSVVPASPPPAPTISVGGH